MRTKFVIKEIFYKTAIVCLPAALALITAVSAARAEGNIDQTDKHAWAENAGWINFNPTHPSLRGNRVVARQYVLRMRRTCDFFLTYW